MTKIVVKKHFRRGGELNSKNKELQAELKTFVQLYLLQFHLEE